MSYTEQGKKKSGLGKILLWVLIIGLLVGAFAAYKIIGPNTGNLSKGQYLYIRTGSTYEDVKKELEEGGYVGDMWSFNLLAEQADYPTKVKAGKYRINRGMSNYDMVRMLRNGRQEPVKLVINKLRTKDELVTFIGTRLEADSNALRSMLSDSSYLSEFGLNSNTAMCAFIPDTYEFFWNTNADKTFRKLYKYYQDFWTEDRKQKAKAQGLTEQQAIVVASIVDEETNKNDEKGNVASVYLNRNKKGMRLQADPTVKYAVGDFTIRRITGVHLQTNSPYNTYLYAGLPPGPICTPSKKSIDAVLNAPATDYIFFCAKEDFSGYHRFASNYEEHQKNARLYQQALNSRGIY
ncbi:MAG: endolytic transglycosylase MltG [Sphingobacteriales bacterium]|nr:MAG: endolytic transglycosylase MltG [Sphingobacteriales bacterium]